MGNCLFLEKKPIRIMKTDGKILEYKYPTRVFQVLSDFSSDGGGGHAISDSLPVSHHLHHNTKLIGGQLYFLVPVISPPLYEVEKKPKKAVRFSIPPAVEKEEHDGGGEKDQTKNKSDDDSGVVRVKIVMTKKKLEEMIENGGSICLDEIVCKLKKEEISCRKDDLHIGSRCDDDDDELQRWKPSLESIHE